MSKGLFDLEAFESKGPDDIIGTNLSEASEFANNSNATNCVDNGVKPTQVSIPGGDKETPTAKPYDANSVTIPGGDAEKPHASAVDGVKVSIPSKTVLTDAEYNAALANLQKSFKEAVDVLDFLQKATVVTETVEQRQEQYAEEVMNEALLKAYDDGPIFEAVKRSDKNDVKKIVGSLRGKIKSDLEDDHVKFYKPNLVARCLFGWLTGDWAAAIQQIWTTRLWQVLGICHCEEGNIKSRVDALNEKYKEELGEYKVVYGGAIPAIADLFRAKFNWKNQKGTYFLLVDKKFPSEITEMQKKIEEAMKEKEAGEKKGDGEGEKKD